MFQVFDDRLYLMDPLEAIKNAKPFQLSRVNELIWLLSKMIREKRIANTEFMVSIHDCVQTVSKNTTYRVPKHAEHKPIFSIVGCNFSDNIPIPMWEGDDERGGGYFSWNEKIDKMESDADIPWEKKEPAAVFRGGARYSSFFEDRDPTPETCSASSRMKLLGLASAHPEKLDVSLGGKCSEEHYSLSRLSSRELNNYRSSVYLEGNCFWADRLNMQLFGSAVILKQETPCGQFYEPLLQPDVHYLPLDYFLDDAVRQIDKANVRSEALTFSQRFRYLNAVP